MENPTGLLKGLPTIRAGDDGPLILLTSGPSHLILDVD